MSTQEIIDCYTLKVPANEKTIADLVKRILLNCPTSTIRINMKFGKYYVRPRDADERKKYGIDVRALEAIECLINARWISVSDWNEGTSLFD